MARCEKCFIQYGRDNPLVTNGTIGGAVGVGFSQGFLKDEKNSIHPPALVIFAAHPFLMLFMAAAILYLQAKSKLSSIMYGNIS